METTIFFVIIAGLLLFITIRVNDIYNLLSRKEVADAALVISDEKDSEPEDDEDYTSAKDFVISTGKASTASLQTAFRWGYNKAARIINDLEHFDVIGPARQGERYRQILTQKEE